MLLDSAQLQSTSLFLRVLLSAEYSQCRAPLLMLLWVRSEGTFQPDHLSDALWFPVQSKPWEIAMTASCQPPLSPPGMTPSCGAARRTPLTAGGSHLGKPALSLLAQGQGRKGWRSPCVCLCLKSLYKAAGLTQTSQGLALHPTFRPNHSGVSGSSAGMNGTVTPLQHWLCNGQKHKHSWNDSSLMEKVLSLPPDTDPASVFAPQLHAAHMSPFFPLLSKPPLHSVSWQSRAESAGLWGVQGRSGGGRWFLWVSGSVFQ